MHDDPVDLTPLDPDADTGAEDRFVGAVMTRIASQPNPYPPRVDVLWGVWSLAKPVLIAASIAIVAAGIAVVRGKANDGVPRTVAESVGVPPAFAMAVAANGGRIP
jgi:hypothetical protein